MIKIMFHYDIGHWLMSNAVLFLYQLMFMKSIILTKETTLIIHQTLL